MEPMVLKRSPQGFELKKDPWDPSDTVLNLQLCFYIYQSGYFITTKIAKHARSQKKQWSRKPNILALLAKFKKKMWDFYQIFPKHICRTGHSSRNKICKFRWNSESQTSSSGNKACPSLRVWRLFVFLLTFCKSFHDGFIAKWQQKQEFKIKYCIENKVKKWKIDCEK